MNKATIKKYQGSEGLVAIKDEWQAILALISDYRFFHSWEWYSAYLSSLAKDATQWTFLLCFEKEKPVAIMPFSRQELTRFGLKFKLLASPAHSYVVLADLFICCGSSPDIWSQCITYLKEKTTLQWDILYSRKILEGSSTLNALTTNPGRHFSRIVTASAYMSCRTESAHVDKLSKKFKRNLRRLRKRADKIGEVSFHYLNNADTLPGAYEKFLQVEASGWKGAEGLKSAIALNPCPKKFYASLYRLYPSGECQINLMQMGDEYVSAHFCLLHNRVLHLLKIGFNQRHMKIGPGAIQLFELLTRCTDDSSIDAISLVTSPPWAERWHPDKLNVYETIFYNSTLKAFLYRLMSNGYALKKRLMN